MKYLKTVTYIGESVKSDGTWVIDVSIEGMPFSLKPSQVSAFLGSGLYNFKGVL